MARFGYFKAFFSLVCLLAFAFTSNAQTPAPTPTVVLPDQQKPQNVIGKSSLYCAGFIRHQRLPQMPEIVGAEEEQEQRKFSDGDVVYLNAVQRKVLKKAKPSRSFARAETLKAFTNRSTGSSEPTFRTLVNFKCSRFARIRQRRRSPCRATQVLLGDLLTPVPDRESPVRRADANLDRFADPSGKQTGRLMMAKDSREMLTRNDIVYIDLGSEDQIKRGDYLTIYRPLGTGNITRVDNEESARNRSTGFQSDRFRGGGFSNQASRAKDSTAFVRRERPLSTSSDHFKRS